MKPRLLLLLPLISPLAAETYDLVVYGGSSAGIAAAVQANRMGASVVVIEPGDRVGGLTTGGLGQTDIGNKHVIGGISREFYKDLHANYQQPGAWKWMDKPEGNFKGSGQTITAEDEDTQWTFEPSAALGIFHAWIERDGIEVVYGERLDRGGEAKAVDRGDGYHVAKPGTLAKGVTADDGRITSITMESGRSFEGRMFIDATYEGDLMASAGVSFTVGREGEAIFGESLNGVRTRLARSHNFVSGVDPYVKPGDRSSGLVKWIDPVGPGEEGASDHRMQAYCFRMCLTDHPDNRIPFEKPEDYDEAWYELLFRNYEAGYRGVPWINSSMPNRKTDTNNRDGFSTDFIGQNYNWPQGAYDEREAIREQHLQYQRGLMWSLANHPRVPEHVRREVSRWGMTKDEFQEGDGWQQQLYVREGRRMVSGVVMTQHHCQRRETAGHSVGMGAYTMDSHNVQRHVNADGQARNEGDVQVGGFPPYPIDYFSIIPRPEEAANLLVPVALSSSHIAFGSIRMEPVFMILGQSAATAAVHALEENVPLAGIDQAKLKERLLADKQVLDYQAPARVPRNFIPVDKLTGIVVDDTKAKFTGNWSLTELPVGVGKGYRHDGGDASRPATATFTLTAPKQGDYLVQVASWPHDNRSSRTPVTFSGRQTRIDQRKKPPVDGLWFDLGKVSIGSGETLEVVIGNEGADGHVIVDAVRLLPAP